MVELSNSDGRTKGSRQMRIYNMTPRMLFAAMRRAAAMTGTVLAWLAAPVSFHSVSPQSAWPQSIMSGAALAETVVDQAATAKAAVPSGAVVLSPHRAVYDITLDRAQKGAGVSDLAGRMVYELTGSPCDGYAQNMRFVTRMVNSDGQSQMNDLRSSSWEDSAGRRLRFNSSQYKDEQLAETTQGDAERPGIESAVQVELSRPKKKKLTLGRQVYFPVQHSIAVLEAARAGKSLLTVDLYDGSEKGEKVYTTTTAIGRKKAPGQAPLPASLKNGRELASRTSWPVSISYFEPNSDKKDAVPTYELAFRFYDNGVSAGLFIDYGEFAIRGELKELVFLDQPRCGERRR